MKVDVRADGSNREGGIIDKYHLSNWAIYVCNECKIKVKEFYTRFEIDFDN